MTYLRRAAATGWFDAVGRLAAELMAGKHTPRDVAQARRLAAGEEMAHMGFYIAYVRPLSRAGYDYGELSKLDQLYSRALKGDEKATRDFIAKMDRPWSKWKRQSTSSWGERVTSVLDSLNTALATAPPIPRVPAR
ncbi:MAG: hypothetical protein HZB13_20065 [Acidobacteria bacterium]|nr:hypothetical protein [Acidobacteriota bacterium]